MLRHRTWLVIASFAGMLVAGCGGSTDTPAKSVANGGGEAHAGHDHAHADPKTLPEAVEVLTEIQAEIATAYKAADVKAVDQAWHEAYPIAKKVKELAADSGLDRYDQDDAGAASDQLVEILDELHPPHGADAKVDPATYEGKQDALNDAIANLKAVAEKVPAKQ